MDVGCLYFQDTHNCRRSLQDEPCHFINGAYVKASRMIKPGDVVQVEAAYYLFIQRFASY